jgi:hypothetical protein
MEVRILALFRAGDNAPVVAPVVAGVRSGI